MGIERFGVEPTPEVTAERLQQALIDANQKLTQKHTSLEVISDLDQLYNEASKMGHHSWIIEADQVKYIAGEHLILEGNGRQGKAIILAAQAHMEFTALLHKPTIREPLLIRMDLFRGKIAEGAKRYGIAEKLFKRGAKRFSQTASPDPSYMRHELEGRAIRQIFLQGETERAVQELESVLENFDTQDDALWIKSIPYEKNENRKGYVWRVWKSGIQIRSAEDLMDNNALDYRDFIRWLLDEADKILEFEDGDRSSFAHRLDELNHARARYDRIFNDK